MADLSGRYPPTEWARLAITAYATHRADRIVAEVNNGGDMVGARLRMVDPNVAFTAVRASRGEVVRAEPVAALYQRGRVHHVGTRALRRECPRTGQCVWASAVGRPAGRRETSRHEYREASYAEFRRHRGSARTVVVMAVGCCSSRPRSSLTRASPPLTERLTDENGHQQAVRAMTHLLEYYSWSEGLARATPRSLTGGYRRSLS